MNLPIKINQTLISGKMLSGQKYAEEIEIFNSTATMPIFAGRLEDGSLVHVNTESDFIRTSAHDIDMYRFEILSVEIDNEEADVILSLDLIEEIKQVAKDEIWKKVA